MPNSELLKRWRLRGVALLLCPTMAQAATVTFLDQEFNDSDWQVASSAVSPVSSYTVGQDTTPGIGNPSPYRRMTNTNPVDPLGGPSTFVIVNFRRLGWSYDPGVEGAIEHIDLAMDRIVFEVTVNGVPISTGAVGHLFWRYQGGRGYFVASDPQAFTNRTWETRSLTGLTASDFVNTLSAGGVHPDFSASGGIITFGYNRSNTNTGQSAPVVTVHGIDNFSVQITSIPLPATLGLFGIGLASLLTRARVRVRKQ